MTRREDNLLDEVARLRSVLKLMDELANEWLGFTWDDEAAPAAYANGWCQALTMAGKATKAALNDVA